MKVIFVYDSEVKDLFPVLKSWCTGISHSDNTISYYWPDNWVSSIKNNKTRSKEWPIFRSKIIHNGNYIFLTIKS